MTISSEDLARIRAMQDLLLSVCAHARALAEHDITVAFSVGPGATGSLSLLKFVPMAPLDLAQASN